MNDDKDSGSNQVYKLSGWSIIFCFLIAILGVVFAVLSIPKDMDLTGAGVCLIAPAIAMGLLANAFTRR